MRSIRILYFSSSSMLDERRFQCSVTMFHLADHVLEPTPCQLLLQMISVPASATND